MSLKVKIPKASKEMNERELINSLEIAIDDRERNSIIYDLCVDYMDMYDTPDEELDERKEQEYDKGD